VEPLGPLPKGWVPKGKGYKATSFLYPVEEGKLLRSDLIPFERRLMYGVLAREGLRLGDAQQRRSRHVDLQHGTIRLDTNDGDAAPVDDARGRAATLAAVKGQAQLENLVFDALGRLMSFCVPKTGLEPVHPCGRRILNPLRLPIPPLRLGTRGATLVAFFSGRQP
jgi:hypothetical protein